MLNARLKTKIVLSDYTIILEGVEALLKFLPGGVLPITPKVDPVLE